MLNSLSISQMFCSVEKVNIGMRSWNVQSSGCCSSPLGQKETFSCCYCCEPHGGVCLDRTYFADKKSEAGVGL